jgi:Uma2 family endonuclease
MATAAPTPAHHRTLAELIHALGDIPLDRVQMTPPPGTATEPDVLAVYAHERRLCELVDGVLVEKPVGYRESRLASILGHFIESYLDTQNLGATAGEAGMLRLDAGLVRIPDLSFVVWEQFPNREWPAEPMPEAYPDLAVEVLSASNTRREMERKRREYFAAGTRLVWEVDPDARAVDVYTDPDHSTRLEESQSVDGGDVLPGFTLSIRRWFERAARGV